MLLKDRKRGPATQTSGAAQVPSISLPRGGGAIRGIDEKFSVNPATGTGSLAVPIFTSAGRSDFHPQLSLSYDSGAGNGVFGAGWSLSVPAIARKTDKGLPRYRDAEENDTFILSGAEDLVPALVERQEDHWERDAFPRVVDGDIFMVQRYRPRVEGLFVRIERWRHLESGDTHWRSVDRDNVTSVYGSSASSRIVDPEDPSRVFQWLLDRSHDDKGNIIAYEYKQEDSVNVDASQPQERNRLANGLSYANRYLKRIKYGNATPAAPGDWLFEVVFDYGEHDIDGPTPTETRAWPARPDAFSTFRAGFEIRTQRLCRRVLMFHHFRELGETPCLVRSTDFHYEEAPVLSYLVSVTQTGYLREGDGPYQKASLPALEFTYTRPQIDETVHSVDAASLENLPIGVDGARYQWVDLDGEGIAGILTEQGEGWFYKRNLGGFRPDPAQPVATALPTPPALHDPGPLRLAPARLVSSKPSLADLGARRQQILDLAGDGQKDLVLLGEDVEGFYERDDGHWVSFRPFRHCPEVDWRDPNLRLIDLNGDGHADVLIARDDVFVWYASRGEEGFGPPETARKLHDEEQGPALVFADASQSIHLADMTGDGLADIVRIRNGQVCYWPSLGYGRFGSQVSMGTAPTFDAPDLFDRGRLRLADIDGSGTTDIIYLGREGIRLYFNQAGNSWSAHRLHTLPATGTLSSVVAADLLGNGTACLAWSSALPGDAVQPMRYIDLMAGQKPHLLSSIRNNQGAETRLQYATSTKHYLEDQVAGRPWITKLPFPVHVIERVEVRERVTDTKLVTLYKYHHGYYDGEEREFRGFGLVEQWDTEFLSQFAEPGLFGTGPRLEDEESHLPPVFTRTWFHTGAWVDREHISRHYIREYYDGDPQAALLPDTILPPGLGTREEREACRALKGRMLRQEVYALDDSPRQEHPYTVSEANYRLRRIQPLEGERHAVFHAAENELLDYHYERNPDDPRLSHSMTLEVDDCGNVTKSVAIGYPRRLPAFEEQGRALITYTEAGFVNKTNEEDSYRVGVPVETRSYELTGFEPSTGTVYSPADFVEVAESGAALRYDRDLAYEEGVTGGRERRLIEGSRTLYYRDDLAGPLPPGEVESLALPYETYRMALTPGLITQVYADRVTSDLLAEEGRYVFEDGNWWAPSGHQVFDPEQFYLPVQTVDPLGETTVIAYDDHALLVTRTEDPTGNTVLGDNDYRAMMPMLVTDPNGNRSTARFDALGMVVATAVMGKPGEGEGDTLDDPTTRLEYELLNWATRGRPNFVHTLARERHAAANPRWQESYTYSDGLGREVMTKIQAEPGAAPERDPDSGELVLEGGAVRMVDTDPRWVGTGRTVYNNKGDPVRQYEPFFSDTHGCEEEAALVHWGVTPILRYDPLSRLVRTDNPDGSFSMVELDAWQQTTWDENDTVLESRWYGERGSPDPWASPIPSDPETRAAYLAGQHAGTPTVVHLDVLGRAFESVAKNREVLRNELREIVEVNEYDVPTHTRLDIEGNPLVVTDARGNLAMARTFDMLGRQLHQSSADAGERWVLENVAGDPIRSWDSRGHRIRTVHDALQRPTHVFLQRPDQAEILTQRIVYGDAHPDAEELNLRDELYQNYDGAGVLTHEAYDFKRNLLRSTRQLAREYREPVDWSTLSSLNDVAEIANTAAPQLEGETFTQTTEYDALDRPLSLTLPDASQIRPAYNEANLLERLDARLRGAPAWTPFVMDMDYNAKGQRGLLEYAIGQGNSYVAGVRTTYEYDRHTFRLRRLRTLRTTDGKVLQDLLYTYDPVGNITEIRDPAQPTIYFDNEEVQPHAYYIYDALYRLLEARGREHAGQSSQAQRDHTDFPLISMPHPNDPQAMRRYTERFAYDQVGNILSIVHRARNAAWTQRYEYAQHSNRLLSTTLPGDPDLGPYSATYGYDEHGSMTSMPHLPRIQWNYEDQMREAKLGGGGTVFHVYDAGGERVRKVHEHDGSTVEEGIYLGVYEIFRKRNSSGLVLERETLHIMDDYEAVQPGNDPDESETPEEQHTVLPGDDAQRLALVQAKTKDITQPNLTVAHLIRYQRGNHLGSTSLEFDGEGSVFSYEEYHPYGTTSYHATRSSVGATPKSYRYTGNERDKETGLDYHGSRFYAPWLGRWTSPDPAPPPDELNIYRYARNNPVTYIDPTGTQSVIARSLKSARQRRKKSARARRGGNRPKDSPSSKQRTSETPTASLHTLYTPEPRVPLILLPRFESSWLERKLRRSLTFIWKRGGKHLTLGLTGSAVGLIGLALNPPAWGAALIALTLLGSYAMTGVALVQLGTAPFIDPKASAKMSERIESALTLGGDPIRTIGSLVGALWGRKSMAKGADFAAQVWGLLGLPCFEGWFDPRTLLPLNFKWPTVSDVGAYLTYYADIVLSSPTLGTERSGKAAKSLGTLRAPSPARSPSKTGWLERETGLRL